MSVVPPGTAHPRPPIDGAGPTHRAGFWEVVARFIPIAIGIGAWFLAEIAGNNKTGLKDLLQFTIALLAGVTAYAIQNEYMLRKVPNELRQEVRILDNSINAIQSRVSSLDIALARQLEVLGTLSTIETVAFEPERALVYARDLQSQARQSVSAMWTQTPYDDDLKDYFADTLGKNVHTIRVVDTSTVSLTDLIDHIRRTWDYLSAGSYEIYLVREVGFEAMLVDHDSCALFIYPKVNMECCYISSRDKNFIWVTHNLFQRMQSDRLPVSANHEALSEARLQELFVWLQGFYPSR